MTYFSICIMQRTIPQVDKVYTLSYRILPKKSMQYIAFITKYQIQWESVSIKDFWIWVQSRDPLSVGIRDEIIIFNNVQVFLCEVETARRDREFKHLRVQELQRLMVRSLIKTWTHEWFCTVVTIGLTSSRDDIKQRTNHKK